MTGYELADEMFAKIGLDDKHELSIEDALKVILYWGFNDEGSKTTKIGFVCYCARTKLRKTFEQALIDRDFTEYNKLKDIMEEYRCC